MADESTEVAHARATARSAMVESHFELSTSLSKTTITLAAGSLGVSLTFVRQIVGNRDPVLEWALGTSWILFLGSLACTLLAHMSSLRAFEAEINRLDSDAEGTTIGNPFSGITRWLNRVSVGALVAGLFLLSVFALWNL